jgi:hypothetical protein
MIEVKSKSYASADNFVNKKGSIKPEWEPYLYDVAFQKQCINKVFKKAFYILLGEHENI